MNKLAITINSFPERTIIIMIVIIGIVIAALSGVYFYNEKPFGDANYYYNTANLVKAHPVTWLSNPRIGIMESLNAVIQGYTMMLPGNDYVNVYLIQILIFSLAGLVLFLLSRFILSREASFIVLMFYWLNNKHWMHIYNFKPGVWVTLLAMLSIYAAFCIIRNPVKMFNYIMLGIWSALLLLTDLRYLPHLLVVYFILLFVKLTIWGKIKYILLSGIVVIILISPWVIRESRVFHKFVFISDLNMLTIDKAFNTLNWQRLSGYDFLAFVPEKEFDNKFMQISDSLRLSPGELLYARHQAVGKQLILNPPNPEVKYAKILKETGWSLSELNNIIAANEKMPKILQIIRRAAILWEPFRISYSYDPLSNERFFYEPASKANNLNRFIMLGMLIPFMLLGIVILWVKKSLYSAVFTGFLLMHTLVHALTYITWRYMLPVLPVVTITAVFGMAQLIHYAKHRKFSYQI